MDARELHDRLAGGEFAPQRAQAALENALAALGWDDDDASRGLFTAVHFGMECGKIGLAGLRGPSNSDDVDLEMALRECAAPYGGQGFDAALRASRAFGWACFADGQAFTRSAAPLLDWLAVRAEHDGH